MRTAPLAAPRSSMPLWLLFVRNSAAAAAPATASTPSSMRDRKQEARRRCHYRYCCCYCCWHCRQEVERQSWPMHALISIYHGESELRTLRVPCPLDLGVRALVAARREAAAARQARRGV